MHNFFFIIGLIILVKKEVMYKIKEKFIKISFKFNLLKKNGLNFLIINKKKIKWSS